MIDTHCHLDFPPLFSNLQQIIANANKAGVDRFLIPGVNPDNWLKIAEIAKNYPEIFPAFGVHPMNSNALNIKVLNLLEELMESAVAVGEIGLDPTYSIPLEEQESAFRQQLRIAIRNEKPVLIHCRHAFERTMKILKEENVSRVGGIMHAFSGSLEMAKEFINEKFAISISAVITRPNAKRIVRVAKEISLESLVVETDSPDLTPSIYYGKSNQPAWMIETVKKIAKIRGIREEDVAKITEENSRRVLKI